MWNRVLREHKIRTIKLPHHNTTEVKKDYRDYYDDTSRALVMARFGPEIERFGYEWND